MYSKEYRQENLTAYDTLLQFIQTPWLYLLTLEKERHKIKRLDIWEK